MNGKDSRKGDNAVVPQIEAAPNVAFPGVPAKATKNAAPVPCADTTLLNERLSGPRFVLLRGDRGYPEALERLHQPPAALYGVGDPGALVEGVSIVGARKATPYGRDCARRFAALAARQGVVVVSGGARGCDAAAHVAALDEGGRTVAVLGGGCDQLYPSEHAGLFQRIVNGGGAVVSEHDWDSPPLPYRFRARNRIIAALSKATLIVSAGLPSGTFSTADEALEADREVLVVPGPITAASSRGVNQLLVQGATPVVDDESFLDILARLFGTADASGQLHLAVADAPPSAGAAPIRGELYEALSAQALSLDELLALARGLSGEAEPRTWLMGQLAEGERTGRLTRDSAGRYLASAR